MPIFPYLSFLDLSIYVFFHQESALKLFWTMKGCVNINETFRQTGNIRIDISQIALFHAAYETNCKKI